MSHGMRLIEKLANGQWLCEASHVEFLHTIYTRYLDRVSQGEPIDREALAKELGRPLDNTREVTIRDGIARIPVEGTIMRRAGLFADISGGVSAEALMADFDTAWNNPAVHTILFVGDSPGGELQGIQQLAAYIYAKRLTNTKRIEWYCDGDTASAAYWLASACHFITTDPTGILGSIGVVSRIRNPENAGTKTTLEFWNARSPKKRLDVSTQEGKDEVQKTVDALGDVFIAEVAVMRGVTEEEVVAKFNAGGVLVGRFAVEAGMADALGTEEGVFERLTQAARENGSLLNTSASADRGGAALGDENKDKTGGAADNDGLLKKIALALGIGTGDGEGDKTKPGALTKPGAGDLEARIAAMRTTRQGEVVREAAERANALAREGRIKPTQKLAFAAVYGVLAMHAFDNPTETLAYGETLAEGAGTKTKLEGTPLEAFGFLFREAKSNGLTKEALTARPARTLNAEEEGDETQAKREEQEDAALVEAYAARRGAGRQQAQLGAGGK